MVNLIKVRSAAIRSIAYDNKVMTIQFINQDNKRAYAYYDVPRKVFEGFTTCESYGGYYSKEVRGRYESDVIHITGNMATVV